MKPERTISYKEMHTPHSELGERFIDRWFVPEVRSGAMMEESLLENLGTRLRRLGEGFPKSDPDWILPRHEDRLSILSPYDLYHYSGRENDFKKIWKELKNLTIRKALYFPKATKVDIGDFDFLVTTPLSQAKDHVKEAEDASAFYRKKGKIDYYYRNFWPFPKNLRIGSKVFYVDRRAIRGFAVVGDVDFGEVRTIIPADTWRWIKPIACDYSTVTPPQNYANAFEHEYFTGINSVKVIGEWRDPMPKN